MNQTELVCQGNREETDNKERIKDSSQLTEEHGTSLCGSLQVPAAHSRDLMSVFVCWG